MAPRAWGSEAAIVPRRSPPNLEPSHAGIALQLGRQRHRVAEPGAGQQEFEGGVVRAAKQRCHAPMEEVRPSGHWDDEAHQRGRARQRVDHPVATRPVLRRAPDLGPDATTREVRPDGAPRRVVRVLLLPRCERDRARDGAPMIQDVRDVPDGAGRNPLDDAERQVVVLTSLDALAEAAHRARTDRRYTARWVTRFIE